MAAGRLYTITIGDQAQTTAKTLIEVGAAADLMIAIERMWISQSSFDTSENVGAKVEDITTTGTGTDSSGAVVPFVQSDTAFSGTLETNSTIEPTYSGSVYIEQGFNVLSGWLWTPANDDEVIWISPSQLVGMMLSVAPSGSMNFSYGMTLRELGG